MQQHKLTDDDLVNYGGIELGSPNQRIANRARRVEECWELMARLGVQFEPNGALAAKIPIKQKTK